MKRTWLGSMAALWLISAAGGCIDGGIGGPTVEPAPEVEGIDSFVTSLGYLSVADAAPKEEVACTVDCPPDRQENNSFCTYRRYTETEQLDRFVAFQPNSATLWPGVVVRGADAEKGLLTPLSASRAPVTFSVSLENIEGSPVGHMDVPTLSAFREERNRILATEVTGATTAALDFEIKEVHSSSQLSLALDASVSWPGGNEIAGSFAFDNSERKTKVVVNFTQAYYTVDVDTPIHPADLFGPDVAVDDLAVDVGEGNPPLYVQSITYGRRVIFTIESTASAQNIEAALSATYQGAAKGSLELSVEHQKTLEESTIRAFVSGSEATAVIDGVDGLMTYIRRGGDYSKDSPGAPIAYKLAYLDNAVTKLALTSEYTERDCVQNRARLRAELARIDHVGGKDSGGQLELYGQVSVRVPVGDQSVTSCDEGGELVAVWNLENGQWLSLDEFSSWTPPSPIEASVENVNVGPGQQLCLTTHILEHDALFGDDDFGTDSLLVTFEQGWQDTHVLQPRGTGENGVDVHVRISLED
jgi:thiol-activated cytolysin